MHHQFLFITDRVFTFAEKVLGTERNRQMAPDAVLLFVKLQNTEQQEGTVLICREFLE